MGKLLSWVILILVGLIVLRIVARQSAQSNAAARQPRQAPRRKAPPVQHTESMVRCAHCNIHLPRSEAVMIGGKTWCCEDHARLGARQ